MATLTIPVINIPDAVQAEVIAAMKVHYATNGVPNPTTPQMIEAIRQSIIQHIRTVVKESRQAALVASEPDVT